MDIGALGVIPDLESNPTNSGAGRAGAVGRDGDDGDALGFFLGEEGATGFERVSLRGVFPPDSTDVVFWRVLCDAV